MTEVRTSAKMNIPNIRIFVCQGIRSFANEYSIIYHVVN